MTTSPRTAVLLTIAATFFWGSNFAAAKLSLTSLPPWTASAERFVIAAVCITVFLFVRTGFKISVLRQNAVAFILLGVVGVAGFNGALFVGLQTSDPITASLIMATTPLSANLLESALNRRLPTRLRIFGAIISLLGVAMVVTNGSFLNGGDVKFAGGDLIILLGSLAWAAYTVGCRYFVKNSTPLETTTWTMISGAITLIIVAFLIEQPLAAAANASFNSQASVVYMAIAGSVLAYLFWTIGISVRGPGPTSVFFNFVPVFALLISVVQGNIPGDIQVLGIVVTILGVLVGDGRLTAAIFAKSTS